MVRTSWTTDMPTARATSRVRWSTRIKVYRTSKSMTQAELAEVLHITRATLAKWECNMHVPCKYYQRELIGMGV